MSKPDHEGRILYWVFFVLQVVPLMIFNGYVLMRLWGWFIVPLGAPVLSLAPAIGLRLIVTYSTYHVQPEGEELTTIELWTKLIGNWIVSAFILFEGWVISHWL